MPFDNIETGRGYVVTLDKGIKDGMEPGHVLAIYREMPAVIDPRPSGQQTVILRFSIPPRCSRRAITCSRRTSAPVSCSCSARSTAVSYAVVLNTTDPVRPGDFARTP